MNGKCQTYTGVTWDILNPDPDDVRIEDIAHALALQCRYNGHTKYFYSVAEHSVRASMLVPAEHMLAALLHDAAEAYIGDMIKPLKVMFPKFQLIESVTMDVILEGLGLSYVDVGHEEVHKVDSGTLLSAEARDLMHREGWPVLADRYTPEWMACADPTIIEPWTAEYAESKFMDAFIYLTSEVEV